MKVKDLIAKLSEFDENLEIGVCYPDYDQAFTAYLTLLLDGKVYNQVGTIDLEEEV